MWLGFNNFSCGHPVGALHDVKRGLMGVYSRVMGPRQPGD